ncbi:hypothetical protein LguiA_009891 [Lonicera macranthoides]
MQRVNSLVQLLLLCATCHAALAFTDGLLPNGNFEFGPKPWQMKGTKVLHPNSIPNWQISGFIEYAKVTVTNESFYSLTFSAARTCAQEEKLNISVSPNKEHDSGILPMQTMYSSDGWDSYSWAFSAESSEVEIVIHNPGVEKDPACSPLIDSVALKALYPPRRTRGNMLKNGNFEEGPYVLPKTTWGVLIPPNIEDDHSPLPSWIIESLKAVKYIDLEHFSVPEGKRAVELVGGRESAIAQVVRTKVGKLYELTFSVGDAKNFCKGSMMVEAFAGKLNLQVPYTSKGSGGFKKARLQFKAISSRTRVRFLSTFYHMKSDNSGSLCGPVIDDVKLLSVHHP